MRVLVTGSAGFIGRHLVPKLIAHGYHAIEVDTRGPDALINPACCTASVQNFARLSGIDIHPKFDVVVHLAANIVNVDARMKGGMDMYSDIQLDLTMCRWLEQNPSTQCAVLMSSCAVDYPDDPYCIVKRNLESFAASLHKKGVPVVVLRPFSGYGEDQSEEYPFRAILERALRREDPLTVWGGSQVRDWLHVDDLTDAIMFAMREAPLYADPIEIGTGIGTSLFELARHIADAVGYSPQIVSDATKASSSSRRVAGESGRCGLQSFGWEPKISLTEGIRRAVESRQAVLCK